MLLCGTLRATSPLCLRWLDWEVTHPQQLLQRGCMASDELLIGVGMRLLRRALALMAWGPLPRRGAWHASSLAANVPLDGALRQQPFDYLGLTSKRLSLRQRRGCASAGGGAPLLLYGASLMCIPYVHPLSASLKCAP